MQVLAEALGRLSTADASELLALVGRIDLAPGTLAIRLDGEALAGRLGVDADRTDPAHLVSEHPFTLSKRGVETKLVLGEAIPARRDETLVRNIALAHAWFERLKGGTTVAEIAEEAGTSKRRVQQMIDSPSSPPTSSRTCSRAASRSASRLTGTCATPSHPIGTRSEH